MNLLHQQVNKSFHWILSSIRSFLLDTDNNKHLNTDLSSTDNSNSQLSRLFQPGTKPIDVKERNDN
jgi:hypothetical protein